MGVDVRVGVGAGVAMGVAVGVGLGVGVTVGVGVSVSAGVGLAGDAVGEGVVPMYRDPVQATITPSRDAASNAQAAPLQYTMPFEWGLRPVVCRPPPLVVRPRHTTGQSRQPGGQQCTSEGKH